MLRIYCDWNDGIDEKRYDLSCVGSRRDIERHAHELKSGLRVVLYQTAEVEAEGVIEYDEEKKRWIGIPDWSTIRYLDGPEPEKKEAEQGG